MQRPIKFRIWSNKEKRWITDFETLSALFGMTMGRPDIFSMSRADGGESPYSYVIQQYTGMLDSKGAEIFEGDIYNLEGWDNNPYYCVWYRGQYFNRRCGQSEEDFLKNHVFVSADSQHDLCSHSNYAIIIGNVCENPELLK